MSAHPATKPMLMFVEAMQKAHARPVKTQAETSVEYESDPRRPGRTAVRITAATRDEAQAEITRCMSSAENMGNSFAHFTAPQQTIERSWQSLGEVIVSQPADRVAG